ncbi:TonB-dependent receptor plug domain-containing protein [Flagellimonas olearia]|uniref:TonB-dependent receptor plug domain-containing protein n=1 Tax=Flagellimonas olearia TaxID=552546 RepID=A0A6I1DYN5_9FLAO|nr:TonB-dependent receptor plug domain-containing protein [Allomuricauda olearia]KAB7528442.1 TonB-dependent receptor plug domain-containing protein [Allomuricauda olearia]
MRTTLLLAVICCVNLQYGQQITIISGSVQAMGLNTPVKNASIAIETLSQTFFTDSNGHFKTHIFENGEYVLAISSPEFLPKRFAIICDGEPIDLGTIFLEKDISQEKSDNLITLTDGDLLDDGEAVSGALGLLQSTKDVFLNRAAFDFGQAFFKVRGYDSRNGMVMINGIPMNKFFDGRPQWNNWGC